MVSIERSLDESFQPIKSAVKTATKAASFFAEELIERKSWGGCQPWWTLQKLKELIERSKK